MYVIKLDGRKISVDGVKVFGSYEDARYALRRKIRSMVRKGVATRNDFGGPIAFDSISRGPVNFTDYGFTIVNMARG